MRKTLLVLLLVGLVSAWPDSLYARAVGTDAPQNELRSKALATYQSQVGVKENLGVNDSHEIRRYLASVGISRPAYYCAAFVCWGLTVNGIDNPRTAWSPSLFPKDHLVDIKKTDPGPCDVFGVFHNELNRIAHAGVVKYWPRGQDYFLTIEGNTNDNGSRNGDGVYEKRRPKRTANKISRWV